MPKTIVVKEVEGWDKANQRFVTIPGGTIRIEHSLKSVEKWEGITEKCFLDSTQLTSDEFLLYVKCMTLNNVPNRLYRILSSENLKEIRAYMDRPASALRLTKKLGGGGRSTEQNCAEMIYYQMIALEIPMEFAKWHLNRLLGLISLVSRMKEAASNPKKKNRRMTAADIAKRNDLNAQRLKEFNTTG